MFLIAFLLGTWGALFESLQVVLIGVGLLYNVINHRQQFWANVKQYKYYVLIPLSVIFYAAIHTVIIMDSGRYAEVKPSFGVFEKLSLCYLLVSLYVLSIKDIFTVKLLKQFLLCFCAGVFSFNFVMLFHVAGMDLLYEPLNAIAYLYDTRFGFTKYFLGGKVYLDAEALHIYVAALMCYFLGLSESVTRYKVWAFIFFAFFVWFLSLTVTKSSILGFLCGFVLFNLYFLRKKSVRFRRLLIAFFIPVLFLGYVFRPDSFDVRWEEMKHEIGNVREGDLSGGGSITPRVVFYKICLEHIDEWGVWGLGVYTPSVSKQWYSNSDNYHVMIRNHSHNSFLQYWMWLGIVGLLFILSWFIMPIIKMVRLKQYSFLALAIILALFIDCQFEVQLVVNDALPMVIFLLSMFYIHHEKFYSMECLSARKS